MRVILGVGYGKKEENGWCNQGGRDNGGELEIERREEVIGD